MMKRIALLLLLVAGSATAQTISPISQDYGKGKARGSFTLTNNQLSPLVVTLSVVQAEYANGRQQLHPLNPDVHVRLSAQSLKIPIRQSREIDFDVDCPSGCVTEVVANMTAASLHTDSGIVIMMHLPTLQYVCSGSSKDCRKHILEAADIQP